MIQLIDTKVELEFIASIAQNYKLIDYDLLKHIDPEFFSVDSYKWYIKLLIDREWKPIPIGMLDQHLLSIEDQSIRKKYSDQLSHLYNKKLEFPEDASNEFRAYISYCVTNVAITSSFKSYDRSKRVDLLLSELNKGINSAINIINDKKLRAKDYVGTYEDRQERRKNIRDNPNINPRILTGINGLDCQFILKAPMIVDFLAPFKRYKSIILNAIGYSCFLQSFNVLHVVYENTEELTNDRYDTMFTEMGYNRISNMLITDEEKEMMDRMFRWMNTWDNRIKLIKCIPKVTTVNDVEQEVIRLRDEENFVPDVEIWDYLNIIAPSVKFREERLEQGKIVWDLKNHAEKFGVLIIEASQANMEGVTSERLNSSHRGKSIDINQGIDLSIGIDQTPDEKDEGIIVLSPQFTRCGEIKIPEVVLDSDLSRMIISRELHKLWHKAAQMNPYHET